MTTLSIWRFDTPAGAEHAVRTLSRQRSGRLITVDDASVVSWPEGHRKPQAWQARDVAGPAALAGAFWGLLFGILFLLPLAGAALGAAAGLAVGGFGHIGLSDAFLQRVRDGVVPGTSALFLLTADDLVDRIAEVFGGAHAQLLVSSLSAEQEAALRRAFDDGDDPPPTP